MSEDKINITIPLKTLEMLINRLNAISCNNYDHEIKYVISEDNITITIKTYYVDQYRGFSRETISELTKTYIFDRI